MARGTNIRLPNSSDLKIQVKMYGEWTKALNLFSGMDLSVKKGYDKGISVFSKRILTIVKRCIRTGNPPKGIHWEPLSDYSILKWKNRYPEHHLYRLSGLYLRSIGVYQYKKTTYVGLPSNHRKTVGGGTLIEVARWLEFGTEGVGSGRGNNGGIPARPLWKPSYAQAGGKPGVARELIKRIRQQLIRDYGLRANQVKMVAR